jgi:hypothetical protein
VPPKLPKTFTRKVVESVLIVGAGVGLMAFGTFGTFTDATTPLPPMSSDHPRDHGAVTTPEPGTVVRAP